MPHPVLTKIAQDTLAAVQKSSYTDANGATHPIDDLSTPSFASATEFYAPDSTLSAWATSAPATPVNANTDIKTEFVLAKASTLEGIRLCPADPAHKRPGVLNFASATRPGGGFLSGARAQEESLARSSNIYSSFLTPQAQLFYALHKSAARRLDKTYTHAMIYTRGVRFFRSDSGAWVVPVDADVLTSAAVNAGEVRRRAGGATRGGRGGIKAYFKPADRPVPSSATNDVEATIEAAMRERMGRLLFLFEKQGVLDLVLGSFGTGVFQNNVATVARLWVELLLAPDARFAHSFRRVVFAIIDQKTCTIFRDVFIGLKVDFAESGT
ncbi:hypothetical protein GGX14DRAFT_453165 [Mycena pura]|uniref:Microbial-type PARG catalytic domain-containing protein n=1 Tax=Mycena pura TaxID=153505 RepID=A0AAD6VHL6_9AGAR|nr:hypothetical protein GGX14DRAFT_453165 [Mycena pura]